MNKTRPRITPLSFAMIEFEDALVQVRAHIRPLAPRLVPFTEALSHVLAEDVAASENIPPFPASVVDGYALRSADGREPRQVVGEVTAGKTADVRLGPGEAVWITTGAPMPEGADAVVKVEETREENGQIIPLVDVRPGDNVRPVGHDIRAGEIVLSRGTRVGPAEVGVLAAVNALQVRVHPRPRVAVMSTGDELREPGASLAPGQIRDSNRYTLMAAVREAGGIPVDLGTVPDEEEVLRAALQRGLDESDMVITSGGVSMGSRDWLKTILAEIGTVHFGRVRMKPGKPITFATVGDVPIFALPGNPVSALVGFYLYVEPAIHILAGETRWERPHVRVRLAHDVHSERGRLEFQRARVERREGELWAYTTGVQSSSRLLSMVGADVLIRLEADWEHVSAGTEVDALVLAPAPAWLGARKVVEQEIDHDRGQTFSPGCGRPGAHGGHHS